LTYELTVDTKEELDLRMDYDPLDAVKLGKPFFNRGYFRSIDKGMTVIPLYDYVPEDMVKKVVNPEMKHYLVLKVNGQPIYCKGGNWGMDDGMKRVSRERLEPAFRLHKDAGLNMIRNWTGETTEEDFYDLCDEYGMLVWNDFWYSTEGVNMEPNDADLFLANVEDVVKRFRNHPSIALWCPRNEGFAALDYLEDKLNEIILTHDGTRYYIPNSRGINLRTSGPWNFFKDDKIYFNQIADGFTSEVGTVAIPTAKSMRKFLPLEDQWPISDAWYYHDFHKGQTIMVKQMEQLYGPATGLDDFCKKSQLLNYDANRAIFEAWNSKLWNSSSGVLLWMTHPAWPSMVWQTYTWDFETPGAYFGMKKACEPLHIQMNLNDNNVIAINTTLTSYPETIATLTYFELSGKELFRKSQKINLKANSKTQCFIPEMTTSTDLYLARLELKDKRGMLFSTNEYWKTSSNFKSFNNLKKVKLQARLLKVSEGKAQIVITNSSQTAAISVKLNLYDKKTQSDVLPAMFSEGYFNLMPKEEKIISAECNAFCSDASLSFMAEGYNMDPQSILSIKID